MLLVDGLFVNQALVIPDNAVDDEVAQSALFRDVELQRLHICRQHLYRVAHIGNLVARPVFAGDWHRDKVAGSVQRVLAALGAFLPVAVVVKQPHTVFVLQKAVVAFHAVGGVGIVALLLIAAINRIAAVEVEVLLAGGEEGKPIQMLQLARQGALLHIRLGQVDSIVPKPMRGAIAQIVGIVDNLFPKLPIHPIRPISPILIHAITLVIEHHDIAPTATGLVLARITAEDDVPHLSVALGLEVDHVLNPYPIEIWLGLVAFLLRGQVAYKDAVDFGLKILPSLLLPHLRLVEVLEAVSLPVGSIAAVVEEVVKRRVLPIKDARELLKHQLAHRRRNNGIAEQGTERLELLVGQEVLDKGHKVRFGLRVSHLNRLVDMEFQPVLVAYCFRNHPSLRPLLQPTPYLLFRDAHRV